MIIDQGQSLSLSSRFLLLAFPWDPHSALRRRGPGTLSSLVATLVTRKCSPLPMLLSLALSPKPVLSPALLLLSLLALKDHSPLSTSSCHTPNFNCLLLVMSPRIPSNPLGTPCLQTHPWQSPPLTWSSWGLGVRDPVPFLASPLTGVCR